MTIGKQRLKGTIVPLKKPMILLDTHQTSEAAGQIRQVLEQKIVFNTRPSTIFDN